MSNPVYNLKKEIGYGSFWRVYLGEDPKTKELYAIKRVDKRQLQQSQYLEKAFWKEVEIMRKIQSPYSVKLYNVLPSLHYYNMVEELCDGDLYTELMKRPNGFSTEEVRRIMIQLNDAFAQMQKHKIVHRDLKVQNILIKYTTRPEFDVKLGDYGFSKELSDDITATKLGTPITMAPEILMNRAYTSKADLWSIGVIIYHLLFKDLPFKGRNEVMILQNILHNNIPRNPTDQLLNDLIHRLLVVDPKKRITWKDYFAHPFFGNTSRYIEVPEQEEKIDNELLKQYTVISAFNTGLKENEYYKCYICKDVNKNTQVFMKEYSNLYVNKFPYQYKKEIDLFKTFGNNNKVLKYLDSFSEGEKSYVIFEYQEGQILDLYLKNNDFTEEQIQKFNREMMTSVFLYMSQNNICFDIITTYNFLVLKNGDIILFDFGFLRRVLGADEIKNYYLYNTIETVDYMNLLTNMMNYGVVLYKMYFKSNVVLKDNKIIEFPAHKTCSSKFGKFLINCFKKCQKRWTFKDCFNSPFLKEKEELTVLFNNERLQVIIDGVLQKFDTLASYYTNITLRAQKNKRFLNEIYELLIIAFIEIKTIIMLFRSDNKKGYNKYIHEQEITLIKVFSNGKYSSLNFDLEYLCNTFEIFDNKNKNNPLIQNFLTRLIIDTKKLSKVIKLLSVKLGKDMMLGSMEFVKSIIAQFNKEAIIDYLSGFLTRNNTHQEYQIAQIINEYIIVIKLLSLKKIEDISINNINKLLEYFEDESAQSKLCMSTALMTSTNDRYIFVSFLNGLFRNYYNKKGEFYDINFVEEKEEKTLEELVTFYSNCVKFVIDSK